jgi:4-hydroxy-tetrahydrodipicolinate reductase
MSGPARIGIAGVNGRMGRMLVGAVRAAGATLVGGIDRGEAPAGVDLLADIAALAAVCDVVIDFTRADAVAAHAACVQAAGTAWVLGTTGLDAAAQVAVQQASRAAAVVQAANFSVGVTLLLALAQRLGAALPADEYDAEIVEMHHRQKLDAPSGTALALGAAVARGRGVELAEVARMRGAGARADGEIGFAALRGGQVVGEHTLSFTSASEQILLTHRAFDRAVFAEGAVRAAVWVLGRPPGLYGMADVLGV